MSLKTIFQEGTKERQRRKSLGKKGNEFKEKEKALAERLTALGQKAWEAKADISVFADLRAALGAAQETLDELQTQKERIEKQKQEVEEKKSQENERLAAAQKESEGKKRDLDKRLDEQKGLLQAGQKETEQSRQRLAAISRERGRPAGQKRPSRRRRSGKERDRQGAGLAGQGDNGAAGCDQLPRGGRQAGRHARLLAAG